jgi:hypothetical protein
MGNQGSRDWGFLFYGTAVQTIQGRAFLSNSLCFPLSLLFVIPPFLTLAMNFQLASISHSTCLFFYVIWKKHLYSYVVEISREVLSDIV